MINLQVESAKKSYNKITIVGFSRGEKPHLRIKGDVCDNTDRGIDNLLHQTERLAKYTANMEGVSVSQFVQYDIPNSIDCMMFANKYEIGYYFHFDYQGKGCTRDLFTQRLTITHSRILEKSSKSKPQFSMIQTVASLVLFD